MSRQYKPEYITAMHDNIDRQLAGRVQAKGITPVTRDLLATDLGLATNEWTLVIGGGDVNTWKALVPAYELLQNRFIAILGAFCNTAAPGITAMRIKVGGAVVKQYSVQEVYAAAKQNPVVLFDAAEVAKIEETKKVTVEVYGTVAQTEKFGLIGRISEPAGVTFPD